MEREWGCSLLWPLWLLFLVMLPKKMVWAWQIRVRAVR
jgi:hypothetical protein